MAAYAAVKDSGQRESFDTGSVRDTRKGKGRYDLISPIGLRRLAQHYENGAAKYGDRNWEKGQSLSRYLDSAERHLESFKEGLRDEDHLSAVVWNIFCIIHTEEMIRRGKLPKSLDDLPSYVGGEKAEIRRWKMRNNDYGLRWEWDGERVWCNNIIKGYRFLSRHDSPASLNNDSELVEIDPE